MKSWAKTLFTFGIFFISTPIWATEKLVPIGLDIGSITRSAGLPPTVNLLIFLSALSFIPFFLISSTSFVRIIIVLSMLRNAIGTQQSPPNSVLVTLALFMTIFIMSPTFNLVNKTAIQPYNSGKITQEQAFKNAVIPFRQFMIKQTRQTDLALFVGFTKLEPKSMADVPIYALIPAYLTSELKTSFQIGFLLFIPFVVVDLIVSNILLSLGMFMLSPVMISLPFKILLFVLTDGWNLIIKGLMLSFQ